MNVRPASMGPGRIWVLKPSPAKVRRTRLDSAPLPGTVHPPRPVGAPPCICLCSLAPADYPPYGKPGSRRPRLHGALMAGGHAAGLLPPMITNSPTSSLWPKKCSDQKNFLSWEPHSARPGAGKRNSGNILPNASHGLAAGRCRRRRRYGWAAGREAYSSWFPPP
jgi:hypothetical protein